MTEVAAGHTVDASPPPGPGTAPRRPSKRDDRVDFFRGLSLLFILWNHVFWVVGGPMPFFLQFTPIYWGFSSSTEAFVFLSGFVYGLVYARVADRHGRLGVWVKSGMRAWHLYIVNMVAMMMALGMVSWWSTRGPGPAEAVGARLWLDAFLSPDLALFWDLVRLYRIPWAFDVLALYIVLLLIGPVYVLLLRKPVGVALLLGGALYVAAQLGLNIPAAHADRTTWYFNPFAWQLLFLIGIVMGGRGLGVRPRPVPIVAAALVIGGAAAWVFWLPGLSVRMPAMFGTFQGVLARDVPWDEVTNLEPLRLAHFLVLAYLVACVARKDSPWWTRAPLRPVTMTGRFSLEVFSFGIVYTYAAALVVPWLHGGWPISTAAALAGCVLSVLFAYLLTARRHMVALLSAKGPPQRAGTS